MPMYNTWVATALSICLQAFYVLYTAVLVFVVQQLATSKLITERHYLTTVHDIANAWTGVGAAVSTLWQQTNLLSSIWAIIGVTLYLICISVMHISSTTIMQFTAYNSTSTISVPTTVPWPNNSVISNGSWADAIQTMPPINLIHDIQSNGLQNTTLYDILTTIQPSFTNATVNATSLQASCGLLSNLSFYTIQELGNINFSTDGLGQGSCSFEVGRGLTLEVGMTVLNVPRENNLVANLQLSTLGNSYVLKNCSLCYQYLFFIITADIDIDGSVITNATNLSCNIAQDDSPPVMAYLAACSLIPETTHATLDLQTNSLIPSLTQTSSQSWKLWSPNPGASSDFMLDVFELIYATPFMTCPIDGGICSMSTNVSVAAQNNSPYILAPNQLEQSIEQLVAAKIWMSGQIGPSQGGFQQINGQSPVTQVITEWRLNVNAVPVIFASGASLVLLILGFLLVGMPPRFARHRPSINGVSVLETLWIAAHSRTICEHMADIEQPSLDNLRKAGMFTIRLGDIYASRVMVPESEAFLE
ncbi:hypothetical protein EV363DRAFT_1259252 [Boletus edulis]|nr:hypothetical protein EV363DRAFT_1259252 [Boletus edulis]